MNRAAEAIVPGLNVSRETLDALHQYEVLVRRWNPAINLIAKSTVPEIWSRHILDSAQLFTLAPESASQWVDLGSGGGFPGIVVAVLAKELQPQLHVTLVEADTRKATFLREAVRELQLHASVLSQRIEMIAPLQADVLSARALASLPVLLGFATQHLAPLGTCLFPKGEKYTEEVAEARRDWAFDIDARPSLSDGKAAILVIRNIHRVQD